MCRQENSLKTDYRPSYTMATQTTTACAGTMSSGLHPILTMRVNLYVKK